MSLFFKYLPFVLGFTSLIGGAFGFQKLSPDSSFTTCVYQSAQLFTMNSGAVQGPVPWTLELARWLAPMATLGAILVTIQAFFFSFVARLKAQFYRNHTILCGTGERGTSIATRIQQQGHKIAVIDADRDNLFFVRLRNLGIPVFVGDALNEKTLRKAGLKYAKRLIAVCGSDEINLKIAGNLAEKVNAEIIIAVEKPELRTLFRDQIGSGKDRKSIKLIGFQFRAAKRLFFEIAKNLCVQNQKVLHGAHIYLEIKDDFLEDYLRAAALLLQVSGDIKPKISIFCKNNAIKDAFCLRYPSVNLVADLIWLTHCPSLNISQTQKPFFDAAVFCCSEDLTTLERADLFNILSLAPKQLIFAGLQKPSNANFFSKTGFSGANSFRIIDLVDFSFGDHDPLDGHLEQDAMELHQHYVVREKEKDPLWNRLPLDWKFLDESFRESNRLQAAHMEIKRLAWKAFPKEQKEFILDRLTRAEHMRWMADKVMHGWRWSGSMDPSTRDDRKRCHHLLVAFDSLSDEEKLKDRDPILKSFEMSQ